MSAELSMISMEERQTLIKWLLCFSMLSHEQSAELAALMQEVFFLPNDVVVEENALVDSVYILVEGKAEVSHQVLKKPRKIKIKFRKKPPQMIKAPLAILHAGDAIGLNNTGFFSTTGKRTATVTAMSHLRLLKLDLKKLHDFLGKYPDLQSKMYATAEQMLRTQFIKQSLPFSRLSQERLMWLANQVRDIEIPAGTVLFNEGEPGDSCYLIRSGQIEITAKNEEGVSHQLAILKTPTLFGEATLITHAPRNATARALDDCSLLELKHEYLSELLESETNVAHTFMTLMVNRSRPLQNPHVTEHQRVTADEQTIIILKNPDNGNYFKLSEEGCFIWQLMDGQHTMQEITMKLSDVYQIFAPDAVAGLISRLAKTGFISNIDIDNESITQKQSGWLSAVTKLRRILEYRIALGDANKWLTTLYQKIGFIFFKPVAQFLMAAIMIIGFSAFILSTSHVIQLFRHIHASWILILFLIPFTLLTVALHELGHALATKSYHREVHYMGIGWYWLGPVAFTDTSDMWLNPKKSARIFVNLAGIFTDIVIAGLAGVFIFVIPNVYIQAFLWLFALLTYINAFRMLNPLQELDGYYVLVDLFDRPRLRQSAVSWLIKKPKLSRKSFPEIFYWLACILFMVLVSLLTLLVQSFIFKIFGFKPQNPALSLALPIIVGVVSCLGVFADIRNQSEE